MTTMLISGASSGIGKALALHLAGQGCIVFAGVRQPTDGATLYALGSGNITPLLLDVTSSGSIAAALRQLREQTGGRLDALINNAGVALSGPLETTAQADIETLFQVNVLGSFALTRACLPLLREARGRILNVGSISGLFAAPGLSAYSASKFALEGMGEALRVELAPQGIRVISLVPGKIDTPIWAKALPAHSAAGQALYQPLLDFYRNYAENEPGAPMAELLAAADHALRSKTPQTRYVIGRAARLRLLLRHLPVRLRDALVLARMGLVPKPSGSPRSVRAVEAQLRQLLPAITAPSLQEAL